jgi:hypothetical protein
MNDNASFRAKHATVHAALDAARDASTTSGLGWMGDVTAVATTRVARAGPRRRADDAVCCATGRARDADANASARMKPEARVCRGVNCGTKTDYGYDKTVRYGI